VNAVNFAARRLDVDVDLRGHAMRNAAGKTRSGAGRYLAALGLVAAVVITACTTGGGPNDAVTLQQVKQTHYGSQAQIEAGGVAAGTIHPTVEFSVATSPPSIFVNYEIPDAQAAAFAAFIGLPPGFSMKKTKIIETDPVDRYWLSLNIYLVSGITSGLRAEWSTYVDDGSGKPRFMIVRARAADGSIDPIGPLAYPEPFGHNLAGDVITTAMNKFVLGPDDIPQWTPDPLFNSTVDLPAVIDRNYVTPDREWAAANDFIYWMNGVSDRTFYNSKAHSAQLISIDLADVTIFDDTEWTPYIKPIPEHVLVYLDEFEFVIAPWWNITEPDGLVAPGDFAFLKEYKKTLYGGLAQIQATSVLTGSAQPYVLLQGDDAPPSTFWHWKIAPANLAAFQAAVGLPAGLTLTPITLQEGDPSAEYWLSLHVQGVNTTLETGLRAEWTTYVDDGTGPRALTIEARADHTNLNPINVTSTQFPYTGPFPVTHSQVVDTVSTTVGSGLTAFSSSFVVPPAAGNTVEATHE
jgi:hypothetical protein